MRSAKASIEEIERGKYYRVSVEIPRDPRTGKRRRLSRRVRGSRRVAEQVKAQLLIEACDPAAAAIDVTLDTFWESVYLPWAQANVRERTAIGYAGNYRCLVKPKLGDRLLKELTPFVISSWLAGFDSDNRRHEAWKMLRQILNRAVKSQMLDRNPIDKVEAPKKPRYMPEVLDAGDFVTYLDHFRGTDIEPAILVICGIGSTRSETIALNWEDIGRDGAVRIDDAITETGGKVIAGKPKNDFRIRTVHLPAGIAARLNELRPACEHLNDCGEISPRPLVTGRDGRSRMLPDRLTKRFRDVQATLPEDVKRISLKNLRHTSLTLAIDSGVDLLAVSRRAGHSGTAITAHYYLRPHESIDIAAAASLDALMSASRRANVASCRQEDGDSSENAGRSEDSR